AGEIDQAFRAFRLVGNSPSESRELAFARSRLGTTLRRVRAITPPPDARKLHADLVRMLTLQHAAAAELGSIVAYEPRLRRALTSPRPAGVPLSHDTRHAPQTKIPSTPTGSARAVGLAWSKGSCGSCHTFTAAGATGTVGPNLDVLRLTPDE